MLNEAPQMINIGVFKEERTCFYRGEFYSVRDNGAICRHVKPNARKRKLDEVWTFGTRGTHGHLYLNGQAVHRIVATAFCNDGVENLNLVVDHIDTNRVNNRPENLRWVTRLENIILNEDTVKKLEFVTGYPIEELLTNIDLLHSLKLPTSYSWMTQVEYDEAKQALLSRRKWLMETEYNPNYKPQKQFYFHPSLTEKAAQVNQWRTLGYFPCAEKCKSVNLQNYSSNIQAGDVVWQAQRIEGYAFFADKWEISPDGQFLWVLCHQRASEVKRHVLLSIKCEDQYFVHSCQTFFMKDGALKYFELAMGREWYGPTPFDDLC